MLNMAKRDKNFLCVNSKLMENWRRSISLLQGVAIYATRA